MTEHDPLALLGESTRADETDVERLRARFPQDLSTVEGGPAPAKRAPWGLALVAAGLVAGLGGVWWALQSPAAPVEPSPQVAELGPLDLQLARGTVDIDPGIRLKAEGQGHIDGTPQDARIAWVEGRIEVDVDPAAGVRLRVETEEGQVEVLGTRFVVEREGERTRVALERGEVQVACVDGSTVVLAPGEETTCRAMTAARWLAAAREAGSAQQRLERVEAGLALGPSPAVEGELRFVRMEALVELERVPDALDEAHRYLALPLTPRAADACRVLEQNGLHCEEGAE